MGAEGFLPSGVLGAGVNRPFPIAWIESPGVFNTSCRVQTLAVFNLFIEKKLSSVVSGSQPS